MVTLTRHDAALAWAVPAGWRAVSSAAVGGGLTRPRWVLNVGVGGDFTRTDLDAYVAEVAAGLRLTGPGCGLLTAADVSQVVEVASGGVHAWATVGVTRPTWPHRSDAADCPPAPGTVNIVVAVPVPLTPSALVQAVGTVTEAKAQVLVQAGVPGTGTASDALVVLCPEPDAAHEEPVPFAGVRSPWGARLATAVHAAVSEGLAAHPWDGGPEVVW